MSNCILNQNVVVYPLDGAKGPYSDIVKTIMDYGIGIHQLPCPEFRHLGIARKPMTKEEYDISEYRRLSKERGIGFIKELKVFIEKNMK